MNHRGLFSSLVNTLCIIILLTEYINLSTSNIFAQTHESLDSNITEECQLISVNPRAQARGWGLDTRISGIGNDDLLMDQINPSVISDTKQYIYCVWQDNRFGDWDIYFSNSANGGQRWFVFQP